MTLNLTKPELLKSQSFINGQWVDADNGATFEITNPADGSLITTVPDMGAAETQKAIEAANAAFDQWRKKTAKERAVILRRWNDLILASKEDLAVLMSAEQGKPLAEAQGEVLYGASFIEWFGEEAKRVYGDVIPAHGTDKRIVAIKQPIGVVAAITPWNFPIAMLTRKVGPALAAGCPAVIKPAEDTPLSTLALCVLAKEAGLPDGLLNVVTCSKPNAPAVGSTLTQSPIIRKISFTGSTPVGKLLMKQSSDTVKKLSLELGGNAPFIVFDDADLDAAIQGVIASKYRNTGQTCVCANRILVQEGVYDEFVKRLVNEVSKFVVGPSLEGGNQQGPLINKAALDKVQSHVDDALSKGAKVALGGKPHALGGTFFEPTILTDVTTDMIVTREETFGPLAPIYRFKTEEEAIAMANNTEFGLASYFYSRDIGRVWRVAEALESGMVGINEGTISTEVAPFGGIKESGLGREGSHYGLDEYVEIKYLCMGGI
jgi:succinate-semialdehyde dehydrogenase / glutarate-semialdehyde dehydrogenase